MSLKWFIIAPDGRKVEGPFNSEQAAVDREADIEFTSGYLDYRVRGIYVNDQDTP